MEQRRIPGPRGRWLVGEMPEYDRDRVGWLDRSRDEYGDVVRLAPHVVVVHDAEAAYQVLAGTNRDFQLDDAVRADQLGELRDRLPDWMRRRRWVTRAIGRHLTPAHVGRLVGLLVEELDRYAGTPDDLVGLCRKVCGRANIRFVVGDDSAELVDAAATAFDDWMTVIETGEARVRWLPRPAARRSTRSSARLRALLTEHVDRRPAAADLLDETATEVTGRDELVDVVFTMLFSTQGLPGVTMAWLLLELAGHPAIAADMRAELADRTVADAVSGELPLTAALVHEVLRLHPPVAGEPNDYPADDACGIHGSGRPAGVGLPISDPSGQALVGRPGQLRSRQVAAGQPAGKGIPAVRRRAAVLPGIQSRDDPDACPRCPIRLLVRRRAGARLDLGGRSPGSADAVRPARDLAQCVNAELRSVVVVRRHNEPRLEPSLSGIEPVAAFGKGPARPYSLRMRRAQVLGPGRSDLLDARRRP